MPEKAVVHVTIERFFEAASKNELEALVTLTDRLDRTLARHAEGWKRPSADEAVLVSDETPWGGTIPPMDWAASLRDDIESELSLDCSVGIAATQVAARICSRMARPRGILLWLEGYEEDLISGIPLEELDELTPEQLERLRSRGIRTLGEMACLAPDEARELLGSRAGKLVSLVRGVERASDTRPGSRLARAVALLSRRLARRLEQDRHRARGMELRIVYEDGVSRERYTLLPSPQSAAEALKNAGLRLLEMSPGREQRVVGLSLTATGLTPLGGQLQLFGARRPREVTVRLGRTIPVSE